MFQTLPAVLSGLPVAEGGQVQLQGQALEGEISFEALIDQLVVEEVAGESLPDLAAGEGILGEEAEMTVPSEGDEIAEESDLELSSPRVEVDLRDAPPIDKPPHVPRFDVVQDESLVSGDQVSKTGSNSNNMAIDLAQPLRSEMPIEGRKERPSEDLFESSSDVSALPTEERSPRDLGVTLAGQVEPEEIQKTRMPSIESVFQKQAVQPLEKRDLTRPSPNPVTHASAPAIPDKPEQASEAPTQDATVSAIRTEGATLQENSRPDRPRIPVTPEQMMVPSVALQPETVPAPDFTAAVADRIPMRNGAEPLISIGSTADVKESVPKTVPQTMNTPIPVEMRAAAQQIVQTPEPKSQPTLLEETNEPSKAESGVLRNSEVQPSAPVSNGVKPFETGTGPASSPVAIDQKWANYKPTIAPDKPLDFQQGPPPLPTTETAWDRVLAAPESRRPTPPLIPQQSAQTIGVPLINAGIDPSSATDMTAPVFEGITPEFCLTSEPTPLSRAMLPISADTPRVVSQQIIASVQTSADKTTDVLLNPAELGRVRISLSPSETGLIVHIQAERPEILDLLRRNADVLAQDFREEGYSQASFSFDDAKDEKGQAPLGRSDAVDITSGPDPFPDQTQATERTHILASDHVDIRL